MRNLDRVAILVLPVLFFSQGKASAAETSHAAVAACTDAIADYFEDRQGAKPAVQIDTSAMDRDRRLDVLNIFELDAFDPATRNVVGRFTCSVDRRAKVRRLITLPLTAPDAVQRRRG